MLNSEQCIIRLTAGATLIEFIWTYIYTWYVILYDFPM